MTIYEIVFGAACFALIVVTFWLWHRSRFNDQKP